RAICCASSATRAWMRSAGIRISMTTRPSRSTARGEWVLNTIRHSEESGISLSLRRSEEPAELDAEDVLVPGVAGQSPAVADVPVGHVLVAGPQPHLGVEDRIAARVLDGGRPSG